MTLYEDACSALVKKKVEFVIIGGFAVNYWGYNRSTGDMDFFINSKKQNLENLFASLDYLGFVIDSNAERAILAGELIQFSDKYHTVELLFNINLDKEFADVYKAASWSKFGKVKVPFIDFDDLILEKIKSKRPKDLNDVYELKKIRKLL